MAKNDLPTGCMSSSICDEELDSCSIISFGSNRSQTGSNFSDGRLYHGQSVSEIKVETVYSLLSMLTCHNIKEEICNKFYFMSLDPKMSAEMRNAGCLPLLIQLIHPMGEDMKSEQSDLSLNSNSTDDQYNHVNDTHSLPQINPKDWAIRKKACIALRNIIKHTENSKNGKREMRVLQLLEEIRSFSDKFKSNEISSFHETMDHPGEATSHLMKISFDEEHRNAICLLGGLHAIAELVYYDTTYHGDNSTSQACITVRRYAFMTLTNLTFGDGTNKSILCSNKFFINSLIQQLNSSSEELRQVTASVLRNLSWKADEHSKMVLHEMGAVMTLMKAALQARKESTLKSILSALWNLSAHSTANKAEICGVDGALQFLVSTLKFQSNSNNMIIVENGGGILRNISSYVARHENFRSVLREHDCLEILLEQLKSPSLTVVSNSCATLWNLSARCVKDQLRLLELGAVPMLRNLVNSKHKMISMGSVAALKNLSALKEFYDYDSTSSSRNSSSASSHGPSLNARKAPLFRPELDDSLSEICESTDSPISSPLRTLSNLGQDKLNLPGRMFTSFTCSPISLLTKSCSKESIRSTHSEPVYPSSFYYLPRSSNRHFNNFSRNSEGKSFCENQSISKHSESNEESSQVFYARPMRVNEVNPGNALFTCRKNLESSSAERMADLLRMPRNSSSFPETNVARHNFPTEASLSHIEAFSALKKQLFDEIRSTRECDNNGSTQHLDMDHVKRERLIEHLESATHSERDVSSEELIFRRSISDPVSSAMKEIALDEYEAEREEEIEYIAPEIRKIAANSTTSNLFSCESRSNESLDSNTISEPKESETGSGGKIPSEKVTHREDKLSSQVLNDELNSNECSLGSKQSEETQDESGFAGSSSHFTESTEDEDEQEDCNLHKKPVIISEKYKKHVKQGSRDEQQRNKDVKRSQSVNFFRSSPSDRLRTECRVIKSSNSLDKFQGATKSGKPQAASIFPIESNELDTVKPPPCMDEAALSLESNLASQEIKSSAFGPKLSIEGFLESTNPPSDMEAISGVSEISSSCGSLNSLDFDDDFQIPMIRDLTRDMAKLIKKQTQDIIKLTESYNQNDKDSGLQNNGSTQTKGTFINEEQLEESEDDSKATYICPPKIGPRIVKPVTRSRSSTIVKKPPNCNTSALTSSNAVTMNKSKSLVIKGTKTTALRAIRCKPGIEGSSEGRSNGSSPMINKCAMNTKTFVVRRRNGSPQDNSSSCNLNRDKSLPSAAFKLGSATPSTTVHKSSSTSFLSNPPSCNHPNSVSNIGRRPQMQRRITSLWKRSTNEKSKPINVGDKTPRSVPKPNSNHQKENSCASSSSLLRSSTYEKLPATESEAIKMGKGKESKENRASIARNKVRPSEDNLSGVLNRSLRLEKKKISDPDL